MFKSNTIRKNKEIVIIVKNQQKGVESFFRHVIVEYDLIYSENTDPISSFLKYRAFDRYRLPS